MSLQHIPLDKIDATHLAELHTAGVAESKVIDYKQLFDLGTDEKKREFLYDIASFANSDGGDLVYGVIAQDGVPTSIPGLTNFVQDLEFQKFENLLRTGIEPRIAGVAPKLVTLDNGHSVLIVRVPRGLAAPHMVKHGTVTRFYGRNSTGKYPLDVRELRTAFLASESLFERLHEFRLGRISRVLADDVGVKLRTPYLIVLHLLPIESVRGDVKFSAMEIYQAQQRPNFNPIGILGINPSYNFDGVLTCSAWENASFAAYVQLFRNGYLESVDSWTLEPKSSLGKIIPSISYERRILAVLPGYFAALTQLGLRPPYVIGLSLLNVRGFTMYAGPGYDESTAIDRDHLITQEILVESLDTPHGVLLRPLFDQIWNACGWPKSINYNAEGQWVEHQ